MPSLLPAIKHVLLVTQLLIGLCIPGSALLAVNKYRLAFVIPVLGLMWVAMISWSRLVINPTGLLLMLTGLVLLHSASYISAIKTGWQKGWPHSSAKNIAALIALALLNTGIALSCHLYKDRWLGFAFYYIPSESMAPTLQPGDVTLIDTWAYQHQPAQANDILIVKRTATSMVLAKRLQKTRKKEGKTELFIVGDNPNRSIDSRRFGWIADDYLLGNVRFVWLSSSHSHRYFLDIK